MIPSGICWSTLLLFSHPQSQVLALGKANKMGFSRYNRKKIEWTLNAYDNHHYTFYKYHGLFVSLGGSIQICMLDDRILQSKWMQYSSVNSGSSVTSLDSLFRSEEESV